ncbi:sugar diacid recognition domain-containing protein [Aneurinibacillus sp. Ricciae_BoGa-3]|uniref:sugar diacid recognition domain-containing protein n=1 Tax=Aneurinibacillus sp. Ricciae_BoGa-3 TaxID=3022697 RepID=UPI002340F9AD|nr:sugar diacid recognition domain-containing protein [Aneurinibacillus sp. Ricciae_BoGa-3]WCK54442.1 sugar diacid recognition domain-containing protein [Aneurinibacillus sp. Ricciae_BoGa-3]
MEYLNKQLAHEIVERTANIIDRNINVMDQRGVIMGSSDPERIGQIHKGALLVIESEEKVEINKEEARLLKIRPGINLPITVNGKIAGVIGITGIPNEVRNYAELVKMAAEMILTQSFLMDQLQWDKRLKEEVINQIIHGEAQADPLFIDRARRLGINLEIPRIAILIDIRSEDISPENMSLSRQKAVSLIENSMDLDDLLATTPLMDIVLLKRVMHKEQGREMDHAIHFAKRLAQKLDSIPGVSCKISIGDYHGGLEGIAKSYHLARRTMDAGRVVQPQTALYLHHELALPVLLSRLAGMDEHGILRSPYQRLIDNDRKGDLTATFQAFIASNGDVNLTAERLFIHRNTLRYRLGVIKEITGKDLKNLKDLFELYISMLLYRLDR